MNTRVFIFFRIPRFTIGIPPTKIWDLSLCIHSRNARAARLVQITISGINFVGFLISSEERNKGDFRLERSETMEKVLDGGRSRSDRAHRVSMRITATTSIVLQ